MSYYPIQKVCLVGGTHGNERTGIHLVREVRRQALTGETEFCCNGIDVVTLLSNEEAIHLGRRYKDVDLNRCFTEEILKDKPGCNTGEQAKIPYEHVRAREIFQNYKDMDLIIDIHNTTSNMGTTLIFSTPKNLFILGLIRFVQDRFNKEGIPVHAMLLPSNQQGQSAQDLSSIGKNGIGLELGPLSHNTVDWNIFWQAKNVVKVILEYCTQVNQEGLCNRAFLTCYKLVNKVDYPRDKEGNLLGTVSPSLRNFTQVTKAEPIFIKFDGTTLFNEDEEPFYPIFISEASYVEKHIAFWKAVKETLGQ